MRKNVPRQSIQLTLTREWRSHAFLRCVSVACRQAEIGGGQNEKKIKTSPKSLD